jgi:hypothetical protein
MLTCKWPIATRDRRTSLCKSGIPPSKFAHAAAAPEKVHKSRNGMALTIFLKHLYNAGRLCGCSCASCWRIFSDSTCTDGAARVFAVDAECVTYKQLYYQTEFTLMGEHVDV